MRSLLSALVVFAFAGVLGCTTVQSAGTFSNPKQPPPLTSGRTVALDAVQCDAPGVVEGDLPETVAWLDQNVDAQVSSDRVSIARADSRRVCQSLAHDRALYDDAVFGTDWKVNEAVSAMVKQLATQTRADHVWVPLVRGRSDCAVAVEERAVDSYSQPDDTLDFENERCEVREADLALFLFDSEGTLLWKSTAVSGRSELATRERATRSLLANLPARAASEGVLVGDTPP